MEDKFEKESRANYEPFNNTILCAYDYDIEFQLAYTNSKFREV